MRIELGLQKSQNSTNIGCPRLRMLAWEPFVFTHGSFVGNSGAAIVSTGARNVEVRFAAWTLRSGAGSADGADHLQLNEAVELDCVLHRQLLGDRLDEAVDDHRCRLVLGEAAGAHIEELIV